jgi:hypothetical protein
MIRVCKRRMALKVRFGAANSMASCKLFEAVMRNH